MQDRFKFRHYNKLAKSFTYYESPELQVCLNRDFESGLVFPLAKIEDNSMYMGTYLELQQCTGLKDKNGKLIYEGDIVKFKTKQNLWANGKVVFTESCALFEVRYGIDFNNWELMDKYQYEVIGNIYENPDLLENTD